MDTPHHLARSALGRGEQSAADSVEEAPYSRDGDRCPGSGSQRDGDHIATLLMRLARGFRKPISLLPSSAAGQDIHSVRDYLPRIPLLTRLVPTICPWFDIPHLKGRLTLHTALGPAMDIGVEQQHRGKSLERRICQVYGGGAMLLPPLWSTTAMDGTPQLCHVHATKGT